MLVALNTIAVSCRRSSDPEYQQPDARPQTPVPAPQGWYPSAVIVLLSDGENNQDPDPIRAADLAADLGVRVYTVGIGSVNGAILDY